MKLQIADNLSLPLDAVTQTFAILAKRRAGKSFLARRFAEELLQAGQQVVLVDPKGDWWGIRSGADGKSPGFPVVILGGQHGDLPLEVGASEIVAQLIVHEHVSVLLDLSDFRKSEVARFMGGELKSSRAGFLEALYRLKNREQFRTPLMLIVDEADAIGPQKPYQGEERMLGAMEDIVRRGGQRGIGCMSVTQRSAVLNKNLLTQSQVLVALRTIAPQDLNAMAAWIDVHGTEEQRKVLMNSLPSLPTGDAWFWSPGWPTDDGIFRRVHVLPIRTFDSGATPKAGAKPVAPKTVADVDLDALNRRMAETIEKARAEDPRELNKRIRELEHRPTEPTIDVNAVVQAALRQQAAQYQDHLSRLDAVVTGALRAHLAELPNIPANVTSAPILRTSVNTDAAVIAERPRPMNGQPLSSSGSSAGWRRMLIALAQKHGLNIRQLGLRAGLSSRSGTFSTYMSKLRAEGYIAGSSDLLQITDLGLRAIGPFEPLPSGDDLLRYWQNELGAGSGAARILEVLRRSYPAPLSHEEIGRLADISPRSGTYSTYLSRLRTLELISGSRGQITISDDLVT